MDLELVKEYKIKDGDSPGRIINILGEARELGADRIYFREEVKNPYGTFIRCYREATELEIKKNKLKQLELEINKLKNEIKDLEDVKVGVTQDKVYH